jgi:predicted HTH transcriptional regulator
MEALEIIDRISNGEDSFTQFKREMTDSNKLAEELVAFSNAEGGILLIGVEDNGDIVGVSPDAIGKLNLLISNTSNENVKPPIYPLTEIVEISDKKIVVINVRKGESKPYQTNKGLYLTKSGSDKRKMSSEELRRLFAESKRLFADEEVLEESMLGDLNTELFYSFLEKDDPTVLEELKQEKLDLETVLENREIFKNGSLTLAGNLIFGKKPQRFSPSFYVDCVYFDGNDTTVSNFVSKATINGTLEQMFKESLSFIKSNLRRKQVEKDFNTQGELEIDERISRNLSVRILYQFK